MMGGNIGGKKRFCFLFLIILVLLPGFCLGKIIINEVMYAPTSEWGGSNNEWVELYNDDNKSFALSGCLFYGKELEGIVEGFGFAIVARDKEKFKELYGHDGFLILENSFERGLKNTGEKIVLEGKEDCSDSFDYSAYNKLAQGNNYTLERREENSWGESREEGGTPNKKNSIFEVSLDYAPLAISEVLPDPFGNDDELKPKGEWVELYNLGEKEIYLRGLILEDNSGHKLPITDNKILSESGLFLPADSYVVIYRDGDSDFTLNNRGYEEVRLLFGEELIDEMSYSETTEKMSWSNLEGKWYLTPPTPEEINYLEEDCDWFLRLALNNSIYQEKDFSFEIHAVRFYGFSDNITVRGKIEDFNGETIREYSPWTNDYIESERQKSYTPNLKEGIYQLSFWFEGLVCKDDDPEDNRITRLIALNPEYKEFASSLEIENIYLGSDNSAEWGDQFRVEIRIHKGNTSRHAVEMWAEKAGKVVSQRSKINVYDEFKEYTLTLPLQLEPNCHEKIPDGKFWLVLEGLGVRKEEEFLIEGVDKNICRDYLSYVKEKEKIAAREKSEKEAFQSIGLPNSVFEDEVLRIKVQLIGDSKEHKFKVWSYLYKGNKCYSCGEKKERQSNLIEFRLMENEVKQVEMLVKAAQEIPEGEYKLKVKLNKDGQKTNQELTQSIYVKKKAEDRSLNSSLGLLSGKGAKEESLEETDNKKTISGKLDPRKKAILNELTGVVVYESSSEKAKKLIPYLLLVLFGMIILMLIFKKI